MNQPLEKTHQTKANGQSLDSSHIEGFRLNEARCWGGDKTCGPVFGGKAVRIPFGGEEGRWYLYLPRWWFQIFLCSPIFGEDVQFDI